MGRRENEQEAGKERIDDSLPLTTNRLYSRRENVTIQNNNNNILHNDVLHAIRLPCTDIIHHYNLPESLRYIRLSAFYACTTELHSAV